MPSQANLSVESVESGGLFYATRHRKNTKGTHAKARALTGSFAGSEETVSWKSVASVAPCDLSPVPGNIHRKYSCFSPVPGINKAVSDGGYDGFDRYPSDAKAEACLGNDNEWVATSSVLDDPLLYSTESSRDLKLPRPSDGWEVLTHKIKVRSKDGSEKKRTSRLSKKLKTLTQGSQFSHDHIEKLLGQLSDKPLSSSERKCDACEICEQSPVGTFDRIPTTLSLSTYLFGSSDVASSECDSDLNVFSTSRLPTLEDFEKRLSSKTVTDLDDSPTRIPLPEALAKEVQHVTQSVPPMVMIPGKPKMQHVSQSAPPMVIIPGKPMKDALGETVSLKSLGQNSLMKRRKIKSSLTVVSPIPVAVQDSPGTGRLQDLSPIKRVGLDLSPRKKIGVQLQSPLAANTIIVGRQAQGYVVEEGYPVPWCPFEPSCCSPARRSCCWASPRETLP